MELIFRNKIVILFITVIVTVNCETDIANNKIISQHKLEAEGPNNEPLIIDADKSSENEITSSKQVYEVTKPSNTEEVLTTISEVKATTPSSKLETNELNRNEPSNIQPEHDTETVRQRPNHIPFNSISSIFGGLGRTIGGSMSGNLPAGAKVDPEVQRAERLNKGFEKVIQMVNIMGQVDSFLSDRTRAVMRRLALLADGEHQDDRYRRSSYRRHHHY